MIVIFDGGRSISSVLANLTPVSIKSPFGYYLLSQYLVEVFASVSLRRK